MKRFFLFLMLLPFGRAANAQIKLPKDCYFLKVDNGFAMANTNLSFLQEDLSSQLSDDDLLKEYLNGFTKTKAGLFTRIGKTDEHFYEVFIPETNTLLSVSSKKDKTNVTNFGKQLLAYAEKNRKPGTIYFLKADGSKCE